MSFSPLTKLVYVPVQDAGFLYKSEEHFQQKALGFNVGIDFAAAGLPQQPEIKKAILNATKGHLSAWDPVQQKKSGVSIVQPSPTAEHSAPREISSSKAPLREIIEAYRADNGQKLWSADAQSGVVAAPMTYTVNGEQYVLFSPGGAASLLWPEVKSLSLPVERKISAACSPLD